MKLLERIEKEVRSWTIPRFLANTILLIIILFLSTIIHELSHWIGAIVIGCKAGIQKLFLLTGITGVECETNNQYIIAALAGPIGSFLAGVYFWFSEVRPLERGELSNFRLFAVILFFLSSIFQLFPAVPFTDGNQAIQFGLNPAIAWLIWFGIVGIVANILISEASLHSA